MSDTQTTGAAIVAYFTANPCTKNFVQVVADFQNAWNAANPTDTLNEDGQYGPLTEGALRTALGLTDVPPNCFGGPVPHPTPPTPPGPLPPVPAPGGGSSASSGVGPLPYLAAALLVAGALAAYTYSKKKGRHA